MKEKNLLSYKDRHIDYVKQLILIDRDYDVPDSFLDYLDDDFIIGLVADTEATQSLADFIRRYEPRFNSYKDLVVRMIELDRVKVLGYFNIEKIDRYVTMFKDDINDGIYDIVTYALLYNKGLDYHIVNMIIHNSVNIYDDSPNLYFCIERTFTKFMEHLISVNQISPIVVSKLSKYYYDTFSNRQEILFNTLSNESSILSLKDYYMRFNDFYEDISNIEFNFITYLNSFSSVDGYTFSDNAAELLYKCFMDYKGNIDDLRAKIITPLIDNICNSNPNNIKLIAKDPKLFLKNNQIADIITSFMDESIHWVTPLNDIDSLLKLYGVYKDNKFIRLSDELIITLIKRGTDPNVLIDHVTLPSVMYYILTFSNIEDIKTLMKKDLKIYASHTINEYIMDMIISDLHPNQSNRLLDVILDKDVWNSLTHNHQIQLKSIINIPECIVKYPHILELDGIIDYVGYSKKTKLYALSPMSIFYDNTTSMIPEDMLISISHNGYHKFRAKDLRAHTVSRLLDYNVGYGYIIDLPSTIQQNFIIELLLGTL